MSLILKSEFNQPVSAKVNQKSFFQDDQNDQEVSDWMVGEAQLSCDVYHDSQYIVVKATMAGVDPKNLEISVSNDLLTIRGFREMDEEVEDNDFYCRECYWGAFSRSIVLPQEVEQKKVSASLKNGILTIKLPKKYKTTSIKIRQLDEEE